MLKPVRIGRGYNNLWKKVNSGVKTLNKRTVAINRMKTIKGIEKYNRSFYLARERVKKIVIVNASK